MSANYEEQTDNKLKEIIVDITVDHDSDTLEEVMDEYVEQIKQAVIESSVVSNISIQSRKEQVMEDFADLCLNYSDQIDESELIKWRIKMIDELEEQLKETK